MAPSIASRAARKLRRVFSRTLTNLRNPIRAAIVGCGNIGQDHIEAFDATGHIRVVAVCDISAKMLNRALLRRPESAGYLDYEEMLDDICPDLVSICTWPREHAAMVKAAAERGVPCILCEKPLGLSGRELDDMVEICATNNVKLACGHQHRFNPLFSRLRRSIAEGELGTLKEISTLARGALINNGIHGLDLARFLLHDPDPVWAEATCLREAATEDRGVPTEDKASGSIQFSNGIMCNIEGGPSDLPFMEIRLETSRFRIVATPTKIAFRGHNSYEWSLKGGSPNCHGLLAKGLVKWMKGGQDEFPASAKQATVSQKAVLGIYEAARLEQRVSFPLRNAENVLDQFWRPIVVDSSPNCD